MLLLPLTGPSHRVVSPPSGGAHADVHLLVDTGLSTDGTSAVPGKKSVFISGVTNMLSPLGLTTRDSVLAVCTHCASDQAEKHDRFPWSTTPP